MNKRETHIVTGMTKDLAISRFEPSYVYDARNIRIRTVGNNSTMLSVTNEKGTAEFTLENGSDPIVGTILGTASFSDTLVIFTKDETYERIYKLVFNEDYTSALSTRLYQGTGLNLQYDHPLETLALFENESIKKVYWVDGVNQPRVINISKTYADTDADKFNFNREIGADAKIKVTKFNSGGEFRPGTVQYCFNYFDKFGQETNIVDVSSLYYISPKDSGLAADDVSSCSFQVTFENLNSNFEYVRLYAIYRSSENATPSVRVVGDYSTTSLNVIVYHLNDEFTEIPTDQRTGEIPFQNLWIVDSERNLLKNVHEKIIEDEQSPGDYAIILQDGQYLLDDRTNAAYYIRLTSHSQGTAGWKVIKLEENGSGTAYSLYSDSGARKLMQGSFSQETIAQSISIIDTGVYGFTIDAEALLFMGGQYFIAETLADKDNTLFFGNITNEIPNAGNIQIPYSNYTIPLKELQSHLNSLTTASVDSSLFDFNGNELGYTDLIPDNFIGEGESSYTKDNNRASTSIKGFKVRENYRLGFVAQYKTGQWSEVIWLGDFTEEDSAGVNHFFSADESGLVQWGQQFRTVGFTSTLSSTIANALLNKGFIKVAPVVVYPKFSERLVVCQGLLCPSVFNISDRVEDAPFAQCDWRFRKGYSWNRIKEEIQCNATDPLVPEYVAGTGIVPAPSIYAPAVPFASYSTDNNTYSDLNASKFDEYFGTEFYLDPTILTFHSPDIDSSEEMWKEDVKDLKLRIVGYTNGGFSTDKINPSDTYYTTQEREIASTIHFYIEMESFGFGKLSELLIPNITRVTPTSFFQFFYLRAANSGVSARYIEEFGGPLKNNGFKDNKLFINSNGEVDTADADTYVGWLTYLWHRDGSLNDQKEASSSGIRTASYSRKVISEKAVGFTTYLDTIPNIFYVPTKDIKLFEPESSLVRGKAQFKEEVSYYRTCDRVLTNPCFDLSSTYFKDIFDSSTAHIGNNSTSGYPIRMAGYYQDNGVLKYQGDDKPAGSIKGGKDPVRIKYNTTRHIVISLSEKDDTTITQLGDRVSESGYVFWLDEEKNFSGIYLPIGTYPMDGSIQQMDYSFVDNCIYIGELYRDMTEEQLAARFGGTSKEALAANTWTLAGEAVKLIADQPVILYFKEGDTYFGRYDCLKSYPLTQQDKQSIVSIYSTEIESRVNLDFRYGNTMNLDDNTLVTPENFNLYNHPGYEQTNQYFTYKTLDYDRYIFNSENGRLIQEFPNTITWSLEKTLGEDVDKWTSISLTSTMDLDGTKGEITKLTRFNNEIFAFQESAFAQVLFNSRVQIPVSDGVPVEITNGYKVDGKRYISEHIGMQNKWSLGVTPYSMYFVDDNKNSIFSYNGQLADLSTIKGMKSWDYMDYTKHKSSWTPYLDSTHGYKNLRTFYDNIYNEVYFTTDTESLVYSETLGNFTSFLDYGKLPYLGNIGNKFLALTDGETRLHELWAGDYNKFFGEKKGYSLTFVANADPTMDKVFNNLEWRSTSYNGTTYLSHNTFDTLKVWHEHQDTGDVTLNDTVGLPTSLKKKFNAFRAFVPRDKTYKMNRIRNPWTYIKLSKEHPDKEKMMFTDLNVDFFE